MEGHTMRLHWQREFTQKEATRRWTSGYRSLLEKLACQYQVDVEIEKKPLSYHNNTKHLDLIESSKKKTGRKQY